MIAMGMNIVPGLAFLLIIMPKLPHGVLLGSHTETRRKKISKGTVRNNVRRSSI